MRELDKSSKSILRDAAVKYAEAVRAIAVAEGDLKVAKAAVLNAGAVARDAANDLNGCWPGQDLRTVTVEVGGERVAIRRDANGALTVLREGEHLEL